MTATVRAEQPSSEGVLADLDSHVPSAVGALAAGPLTDRFGRKSLLILDVTIYAVWRS